MGSVAVADYLSAVPGHSIDVGFVRRLVLELAVRGQIDGQGRLGGDGGSTPWLYRPLSELVDLESGKRMPGGARSSGVISLGGEHIRRDGTIDYEIPRYVSKEFFAGMKRGVIRPGDTLMIKDGATTGQCALVESVPPGGAAVNEHVFLIRSRGELLDRFLYFLCRSLVRRRAEEESTGIVGGIRRATVLDAMVPVPPIEDQRRTIELADALLAHCDLLEVEQEAHCAAASDFRAGALDALMGAATGSDLASAWRFLADNWEAFVDDPLGLKELVGAVQALAVRGRLLSGEPKGETVEEVLGRIHAARDGLGAQGDRTSSEPPLAGSDDLVEHLPDSWRVVPLGSITELRSGVTKGRRLHPDEVIELPYLRVANVKAGELQLDEVKTIPVRPSEVEKYRLHIGDVLLTEGGDWDKLGRSAIWSGEMEVCLHQNHIFRARPLDAGISSAWLSLVTNSPYGRAYFQSKAKRTTNLASINMTELREAPIPLPPPDTQRELVELELRVARLCDEIATEVVAQQQRAGRLAAAILRTVVEAEI